MKLSKVLIFYLLVTMLVLMACNLSKAATPMVTETVPTASTIPAVRAGPISLAQLYEAKVKAGDWTEGQGLINLLGLYTGSANPDDVLGTSSVDDFELTELMRSAQLFLSSNPTGKAHDDLQKQVNLLQAPIDKLDPFSRKAALSPASKGANPVQPQPELRPLADEAQCQRLWADGFTSTTPVLCFQYADQDSDGTRIRLYYPDWWAPDDPRISRMEPILQAAAQAVHVFNAYGPAPIPPVTLVVTELPGTDPTNHHRNPDLLAMAVPHGPTPLNCYVGIFPSLFTKTVDEAQQALAHELFHCYQYQNLSGQESGPLRDASEWWVEGSAEYFSNVVYPSTNFEHRWLAQLPAAMLDDTLFTWSYKAFIFFQYLENRADTGIPGILRLLNALPTTSGSSVDQQVSALSGYPSMASIFQGFGEAVADQNIRDTDHSILALQPPFYPDDVTEPTSGDIFGRGPFAVDLRRLIFPQDFNYEVSTTIEAGNGEMSAHSEAGPQTWGPLPVRVSAGCIEVHYVVVLTQTASNPETPYEVMVRAASEPSTGLCSCLTGRWTMDDGSYLTHLNGLIQQAAPGSVQYTDVSGSDVVEFTPDGAVTQNIDNLTVRSDMNVPGLPTQQLDTLMNGTTEAGFQELNGALTYIDLQSQLALSMTMNGQPLTNSAPIDYLASGPLGTGATYTCSGDQLTLIPVYPRYSNLPPLLFQRVQP